MAEPRVAFLEHLEGGVLTNATSVTLSDPDGNWGIREAATEATVVPAGAPTVNIGTGLYEYDISALNPQIEYEIFWCVIDSTGNIEYIFGLIPTQEIKGAGSGGAVVPADILADPSRRQGIDCDNDGYADAYAYDLDGDGTFESFDFDGDNIIDQVDYGTVKGPSSDGIHITGTGEIFDARGVRVGLGGNIGGTGSGVSEDLDGIPDVPSPRGTPATDGTWGGTLGYDGTSGDIPATGGLRSNRNESKKAGAEDSGYWDGISFQKLCTIPLGPRGMCLKDKCLAALRNMLRDTDPSCQAFTNDELDLYLEASLWAFNAKPTFTSFLWDNLQERWADIIVKGATVWSLYAQGLIEAGREFQITDNGISFTPPPVSDKLHSYAAALLAHYERELLDIKQNFRPIPAAVGVFSVLDISPSLRRLRHLREKRIF